MFQTVVERSTLQPEVVFDVSSSLRRRGGGGRSGSSDTTSNRQEKEKEMEVFATTMHAMMRIRNVCERLFVKKTKAR